MSGIVKAFNKAFKVAKERGWDKIYVAVDLHETVLKPTWSAERSIVFYDYAMTVLQHLSKRKDVCLIMFTSSSEANIDEYYVMFDQAGIFFKYANCNPEVPSTSYANFDDKFYMNVIIDDKCGFDAEKEWFDLLVSFELENIK